MMNTLIGSTSRVALWLLLLGTIWAQQPTGSLQGTVLDESGAVIPGAKVEVVRNQKIAWQLPSDSLGNFSFLGLAPGEYLVRVDANGFKTFESSPQKVTAGNVITLAVALDVLTASEQVTVTSDQSGTVTLEASDNANAVVLRGADLDALPDDPEELMDDSLPRFCETGPARRLRLQTQRCHRSLSLGIAAGCCYRGFPISLPSWSQ